MSDQNCDFGEEFLGNTKTTFIGDGTKPLSLTNVEFINETREKHASHSPKESSKAPKLPPFNRATTSVPNHIAFYDKVRSLMISNCNGNGRMKYTHVIALLTSVLLFILLCLLMSSTEARNENQGLGNIVPETLIPSPEKIIPPLYPSSAALVMERIEKSKLLSPSWKMLPEYVKSKHGLKFVLGKGHYENINEDFDVIDLNDKTFKVAGNPRVCKLEAELHESRDNTFSDVTHVEVSEISNCKHFVNTILNSWTFPKIQHIKLHRMVVDKEEFLGLINFIDRHNETISKVEIDACYVCPQPVCDAGLINYPDHDFHIAITRRRDSPEWVS